MSPMDYLQKGKTVDSVYTVCIRYFMQEKDVFRVIPGVFSIPLTNRGIFGVGIFTELGRLNA